jgi:hypothetical protein
MADKKKPPAPRGERGEGGRSGPSPRSGCVGGGDGPPPKEDRLSGDHHAPMKHSHRRWVHSARSAVFTDERWPSWCGRGTYEQFGSRSRAPLGVWRGAAETACRWAEMGLRLACTAPGGDCSWRSHRARPRRGCPLRRSVVSEGICSEMYLTNFVTFGGFRNLLRRQNDVFQFKLKQKVLKFYPNRLRLSFSL